MTTLRAIVHVSRWALTLILLAALGGCYLLQSQPPRRHGATEDFDAVVTKIQQLDGVADSSRFKRTDDVTAGSYVTAVVDVEEGYDPVEVLDSTLAELYWFGEYGPTSVEFLAVTSDGEHFGLQGTLPRNGGAEWLYSEDMEERYGP